MSSGDPKITVVTPCLNAAGYIRQTIDSVLSQDYPYLEYIVADGGSNDGTLEILEEYCRAHPGKIRVISRPDSGVADALQRCLPSVRGEVFAYLNADDLYVPGAIRTAIEALSAHPEAAGVYGNAHWIDQGGNRIADYPTEPFDHARLAESCFICQPACFLRTSVLCQAGGFDAEYKVVFDYELWLRLSHDHHLVMIQPLLAKSRMHRDNKTLRQRSLGLREAARALQKHNGYVPFGWAHTYASFILDRRDQFFEPLRPSIPKYVASLFVGMLWNWTSPCRYWNEWSSVMSLDGLVRRWNDTWIARHSGLCIR